MSEPVITAYLGLGSNLGDREANLHAAVEALEATPGVLSSRLSTLIETEPVGTPEHPARGGAYINAVVEIETTLSAVALLRRCLEIERGLGRIRTVKNAPRTIDIDLLLYGATCLEPLVGKPDLEIPHPRLHERAFVLEPLLELNPDLRHPRTGRRLTEYLLGVDPPGVRQGG